MPFDAARDALTSELGQPIESAFLQFNSEPLAAASIGQAHAAVLPDGTEVVVKIRRPGVVEQVNEDLEILKESLMSQVAIGSLAIGTIWLASWKSFPKH